MTLAHETNDPAAIEVIELGHGVPLARRALPLPDKLKEGMRPETAADNQIADPVGDIKQPTHTFDGWHFLQENRRVESTPHHVNPSPLKYTEQLENRQRPLAESNSLFSNLVGFLSPVLFERRAA